MTRRAALLLAPLLLAGGCVSPIPRSERIVLVTFDTTRADRIGCYGYADAETPVLDELARDGVLFEQAVSPVPTTLPSHATMFTGLLPQDHGVRYNIFYRLSDEANTLAETLSDAGYATAAFPATHILSRRFGLNQGFETWIEPPERRSDERKPDEHRLALMRPAADGVDQALEWIDEHAEEPFFIWLHFYDPHAPYQPPFPYSSRYRDRPYDGELAYADAQLGRLLKSLRTDPSSGRTLVVVAGDHGEGLYDHGEQYHSLLTYETTQRVPLIINVPGARSGRVAEPVMLADIMPTVLDMAQVPPPNEMRGISLKPMLHGGTPDRRDLYFECLTGAITYGWAELHGIRFGRWKLIDSPEPELFDLQEDPEELNNLAGFEPELLADLRAMLSEVGEPLASGTAADSAAIPLDPQTEAMLTSLGYIGGATAGTSAADARHPKDLVDMQPEMLSAQTHMVRRDWKRVLEVCRYVLTRDPKNKWALHGMANAFMGSGDHDSALEYARKLVEVNPASERAHALLAQIHGEREEPQLAHEALQHGLEEVPGSEFLIFLSLVAGFELGRPTVCNEVDEAVTTHSESGRMLVMRARCEARDGQPEKALETLEAAVELDFRQLRVLQNSPDFAGVIALPDYKRLEAAVKLLTSPNLQRPEPTEPDGS